jgi:hypothetical protein
MRLRKLDENGDMVFGHGSSDFYFNTPQGVAQSIETRLKLIKGEWFLDITQGTDWGGQILGRTTEAQYDGEIQRVILETNGVLDIESYASNLQDRQLSVTVTVNTIYDAQAITLALTLGTQIIVSVV